MLDYTVLQQNGTYDGLAAIAQYACTPVEPGKGTVTKRRQERYEEGYCAIRNTLPASYEETGSVIERLLADGHLDSSGFVELTALNNTAKRSRGIAWLAFGWGFGKYLLHKKHQNEAFAYAFSEYPWMSPLDSLCKQIAADLERKTGPAKKIHAANLQKAKSMLPRKE